MLLANLLEESVCPGEEEVLTQTWVTASVADSSTSPQVRSSWHNVANLLLLHSIWCQPINRLLTPFLMHCSSTCPIYGTTTSILRVWFVHFRRCISHIMAMMHVWMPSCCSQDFALNPIIWINLPSTTMVRCSWLVGLLVLLVGKPKDTSNILTPKFRLANKKWANVYCLTC